MGLAKAWDQFLASNTSGTSCLGPLAGLEKQRAVYERTVQTLGDAAATTLFLVSRPQLGRPPGGGANPRASFALWEW